jgi:pyruvate kinase
VAVSPLEETVRRLALVWGVSAVIGDQAGSLDERFREAIEAAEESGNVKKGDQIIMTGGVAGSRPGTANALEIYTVGDER